MLYLYNGLLDGETRLVDAACGGNILNTTPDAAMLKMQELAEATRNFGKASNKRGVNAMDSNRPNLVGEIVELKNMIKKLTLQGTP